MSHQCPTAGCDRRVEDSKLMCREHWFELSRDEQQEVWNSLDVNGPGPAHIKAITPILNAQKLRLFPARNQGKPFGL